jgi:hypothetical protein
VVALSGGRFAEDKFSLCTRCTAGIKTWMSGWDVKIEGRAGLTEV